MYNDVGYALPANNVKNVVENVIDFYTANYQEEKEDNTVGVYKYLIGITITIENPRNVYDEAKNINKLYEDVTVTVVNENSTASQIGVEVGDIVKSIKITRANGDIEEYEITRMHMLVETMLTLRVGDSVEYTVSRLNEAGTENEDIKLTAFEVVIDNYSIV